VSAINSSEIDHTFLMTRRRWIADNATETTASLLGPQAEHLARVLRAQPGMEADVAANGRVYHAVVIDVSLQEVKFNLIQEVETNAALPITLLLAIYKFDRMEWAIEKATELGVASIAPVVTRRTEKHLAQSAEKRVERWRRIAQEAAKQSRRADVPFIEEPTPLAARLAQQSFATKILLAENERDLSLRQCIQNALASEQLQAASFLIAVGPEGGWAEEELASFGSHGYVSASLGPRILRAETAAIVALAVASSLL
jgi:16S rRNA (uracil1498-N3)-methyltransferase